MESCGSWPRTYYINLPLVHLDIVFTNLVTEELGGGLVEGAFLGFEEELEFSLVLEDLQNMLAIFSQGCEERALVPSTAKVRNLRALSLIELFSLA